MLKLTMSKFKRLCDELSPLEFIYDSKNQSAKTGQIEIDATYNELFISQNPNRICLRNPYGILCFNRVRFAYYDFDARISSYIFKFICGESDDDITDVVYTVIAKK